MIDPDFWEIWRRNPLTGELIEQVAEQQRMSGVATLLCNWTGYKVHELHRLAVSGLGRRGAVDAEVWLEEHPIEALIAAWNAGSQTTASNRQKSLHDLWPALAKAIDNVEANNPHFAMITKAGPPVNDEKCPCGKDHTKAEHGYTGEDDV